MKKRPLLVIDLDNTLNNLVEVMCNAINYTDFLEHGTKQLCSEYMVYPHRLLNYSFNQNLDPKLVPDFIESTNFIGDHNLNAKRDDFIDLCHDIRIFKHTEILHQQELIDLLTYLSKTCDILIHTLSFTEEIAKFKYAQLLDIFESIPNLTIKCPVGYEKVYIVDADYVLDDCLDNINGYITLDRKQTNSFAKAKDHIKTFLIDQPYNQFCFNTEYITMQNYMWFYRSHTAIDALIAITKML